jgi:mono/diheme cytochrome c family protein
VTGGYWGSRVLVAVAGAGVVAATLSAAQDGTRRSVWDGVYTEAQAMRGERDYGRSCERCHGVDLTGDPLTEIPALQSAPFVEHWQGKTLKDLFDVIKRSMPADEPDSLTTRAYVDIVAYLLSANHFPTGGQELSREPADLQQIRFEPERK